MKLHLSICVLLINQKVKLITSNSNAKQYKIKYNTFHESTFNEKRCAN